jgi:hypothetical protein
VKVGNSIILDQLIVGNLFYPSSFKSYDLHQVKSHLKNDRMDLLFQFEKLGSHNHSLQTPDPTTKVNLLSKRPWTMFCIPFTDKCTSSMTYFTSFLDSFQFGPSTFPKMRRSKLKNACRILFPIFADVCGYVNTFVAVTVQYSASLPYSSAK